MKSIIVVLFLVISLFFPRRQSIAQGSNQESLESIRDSLRQGWHRLKNLDESQRQYSVKIEFTAHGRTKVRKDVRSVDIHVSPPYFLGQGHYPDSGTEVILGHNPSYAFLLKKERNATEWQLGPFGEGADVKGNPALNPAVNSLTIANHYPLSSVSGLLPENWLTDPGIKIMKVVRIAHGRYQISYTNRGVGRPHAKPNEPYHLETVMTVDPNIDWCVLEIDQHGVNRPADYHMTREVAWEGAHLICRRVAEKEMYVIPVGRSWDFDNYKFDVKDTPEIFYLSHYGLPEPIGVKPPERPRTWLWLIMAVLAAAALACLFSWLKRRHEIKHHANPPLPSDRSLS